MNKLPQLYHPLFTIERFKTFSSHGFFISIEKHDDTFDIEKVKGLLEKHGGKNIEEIRD